MKITVIGCGRWGSFIAWYLDRGGHDVTLYGKADSAHMRAFLETRKNDLLTLPEGVTLATDLSCVDPAELLVLSVPSQNLRELMSELAPCAIRNKTLVLCMKGIEIGSGKRLSEIVSEAVDPSNKVAVWPGPGHVQEFLRGVPNCMVIDSTDEETKHRLVDTLSTDLIRFYYGDDLIGNEVGAAAKNVIGIAAGMLDGFGLTSLKGALMTRGAREISRLIVAMGGKELSAYGLCHLGDYEATVFSPHSHNRRFGEDFVRGIPFTGGLAEGYYTAQALYELEERYGVDLPICHAMYLALYRNEDPKELFRSLFSRSLKNEFYKK